MKDFIVLLAACCFFFVMGYIMIYLILQCHINMIRYWIYKYLIKGKYYHLTTRNFLLKKGDTTLHPNKEEELVIMSNSETIPLMDGIVMYRYKVKILKSLWKILKQKLKRS